MCLKFDQNHHLSLNPTPWFHWALMHSFSAVTRFCSLLHMALAFQKRRVLPTKFGWFAQIFFDLVIWFVNRILVVTRLLELTTLDNASDSTRCAVARFSSVPAAVLFSALRRKRAYSIFDRSRFSSETILVGFEAMWRTPQSSCWNPKHCSEWPRSALAAVPHEIKGCRPKKLPVNVTQALFWNIFWRRQVCKNKWQLMASSEGRMSPGIFNQADSSMTNVKERGNLWLTQILRNAHRYNPLIPSTCLLSSIYLYFSDFFFFFFFFTSSFRGCTHFLNLTQLKTGCLKWWWPWISPLMHSL